MKIIRVLIVPWLLLSACRGAGAPAPDKQDIKPDTVTISFIGDVMQHGGQIKAALRADGTYDYTNTFRFMEKEFKEADYMVANMEFTVGSLPYSGFPFFSAPKEIATQAKESGIDLFLMANNHICDRGAKGFERTINAYNDLNIHTLGAYRSKEEADTSSVLMVELKGMRFAFFNFTYSTNGIPVPHPYYVNMQDSTEIKKHIAEAKEKNADFIIALPHWGEEYHTEPSQQQKEYAQFMFNEGVDAIIGGHPHVPEEGYIYAKGDTVQRVVFYSLGNYVSNQYFSGYTHTGIMVSLHFERDAEGNLRMLMPHWKYLWCFRKGQLLEDYTVVPMEEFINGEEFKEGGKTAKQKESFKMLKEFYPKLIKKDLIKIITD